MGVKYPVKNVILKGIQSYVNDMRSIKFVHDFMRFLNYDPHFLRLKRP